MSTIKTLRLEGRRILSLFLFGSLCASVLGAGEALAVLAEYSAGHADVRPLYEDGVLSLSYRFDNTAVVDGSLLGLPPGGEAFMDPNEVYVRASDATGSSAPAAFPAFFTFLGSPIPNPVYVLPQNNVAGQPFFGFSTEELVSTDWLDGGGITWSLTNFVGPGNFALYQTSGFSNSVKWQTSDGVDATDNFNPPLGHDHYNWAFTEPGVYSIDVTANGTHAVDGAKSASAKFYFAVGDATSAPTAVPEPARAGVMLVALCLCALVVGRTRS